MIRISASGKNFIWKIPFFAIPRALDIPIKTKRINLRINLPLTSSIFLLLLFAPSLQMDRTNLFLVRNFPLLMYHRLISRLTWIFLAFLAYAYLSFSFALGFFITIENRFPQLYLFVLFISSSPLSIHPDDDKKLLRG